MLINKIKKKILFFTIIFLLVIIDLVSKWLIVFFLRNNHEIVIIPHLIKIVLFYNCGGVFGFGKNIWWVRLFLIIIRSFFLFLLPYIFNFFKNKEDIYYQISYMLSYAGCIGNLIDISFYWTKTVGFNGVIDWIKLSFFNYVFNLADAYVSLALFFLLIKFLFDYSNDKK